MPLPVSFNIDGDTATGRGPSNERRKMISTNRMLTGNRISRQAKMSSARVDSAMVPTKPMLKMATTTRHS